MYKEIGRSWEELGPESCGYYLLHKQVHCGDCDRHSQCVDYRRSKLKRAYESDGGIQTMWDDIPLDITANLRTEMKGKI